jgi:dihydroxyacetone kinase
MKKLINKPEDVVLEELKGIEIAHPDPGRCTSERKSWYYFRWRKRA